MSSFYGSKRSSSRSLPKKRLNAASVGQAIRISHGIEKNCEEVLDDLSDLSDLESDLDLEGDARGQPEINDTENELLFNNSGSMYTFEHLSTPHTSTPLSSRPHSSASSTCGSSSSGSTSLASLIQPQNQLILELLQKQDSMTSAIEEVKHDLKETRTQVDQLREAQQSKVVETDKTHKRKYPSSLTVIMHDYM